MKILVVEDDRKIAQFISGGLAEEGFALGAATDGEQAIDLIRTFPFDLIILDLMLPKIDGLTVLQTIRAEGILTPVIILSAKRTTEDKVTGLRSGADDYLAKPFSFSELMARIYALLRRAQGVSLSSTLRFAEVSMDRVSRQVYLGDKKIELQAKEFLLLELFLKNPERVLSKAFILDQVWNLDFDPQTNVVDVLVCRLRNKMAKAYNKKFIYTVRSAGYVLK